MSAARVALLVACAAALGGCSSIPPGGDPALDPALRHLGAAGGPTVAVAPPTIALADDEARKGWTAADAGALAPDDVRDAVMRALAATGAWSRVRRAAPDARADAWAARDEVLVEVAVEEVRAVFDGRNGWWLPNIASWLLWMVPAWFAATEEFSLHARVELVARSVDSGAPLLRERFDVEARGSFDEFDRGWHFFGFVYTPLEPGNWQRVASQLAPELARRVAVEVGRRAAAASQALRADPATRAATRKVVALVVGVGRYADPIRLPDLPAADDARSVAAALVASGVAPEHVALLLDGAATLEAIAAATGEHLRRARRGDGVLVYFAGYGTRDPDGTPALLLASGARLRLDDLDRALGGGDGAPLLVVDAAFDGGERAVPAAGAPTPAVTCEGARLLLASEPAQSPVHLGHGLLTHHLLCALADPAADADGDGRVDADELFARLLPAVVAEAALGGTPQAPVLTGVDRGFWLGPPPSVLDEERP